LEKDMQGKKILVIDDDPTLRDLVERTFSTTDSVVVSAPDGAAGLRAFYAQQPDLVILDIMMPSMDGWEVCRRIRQLTDVPVILLTALNQDEDVIRGLDAGADDFVNKPFNPKVLLARARAALRRGDTVPVKAQGVIYQDDHLHILLDDRLVEVLGDRVKLSPKEYRLLAYLVENRGRVCTSQQILEHVWGWAYQDSVDYVHVYISHLRRKLEPDPRDPRYLLTEHGIGYRFDPGP
jgi:two-component system KDP operon response regulator KdpE